MSPSTMVHDPYRAPTAILADTPNGFGGPLPNLLVLVIGLIAGLSCSVLSRSVAVEIHHLLDFPSVFGSASFLLLLISDLAFTFCYATLVLYCSGVLARSKWPVIVAIVAALVVAGAVAIRWWEGEYSTDVLPVWYKAAVPLTIVLAWGLAHIVLRRRQAAFRARAV